MGQRMGDRKQTSRSYSARITINAHRFILISRHSARCSPFFLLFFFSVIFFERELWPDSGIYATIYVYSLYAAGLARYEIMFMAAAAQHRQRQPPQWLKVAFEFVGGKVGTEAEGDAKRGGAFELHFFYPPQNCNCCSCSSCCRVSSPSTPSQSAGQQFAR